MTTTKNFFNYNKDKNIFPPPISERKISIHFQYRHTNGVSKILRRRIAFEWCWREYFSTLPFNAYYSYSFARLLSCENRRAFHWWPWSLCHFAAATRCICLNASRKIYWFISKITQCVDRTFYAHIVLSNSVGERPFGSSRTGCSALVQCWGQERFSRGEVQRYRQFLLLFCRWNAQ